MSLFRPLLAPNPSMPSRHMLPLRWDARSSGLVLEPCRSVANRAPPRFRSDLSALDRAQLMLREIAVWFPSMSEGDRADLSFQPGYIV
jgi:hypothetical protein